MIERAIRAIKNGNPILIYDGEGREEETDIVVGSQFITYKKIRFMRREGGGLICTTLPNPIAKKIGLPYLHELFKNSNYEIFRYLSPDVKYDTIPSFSITINHVDNYTGIPDRERAKTIKEFAEFIKNIKNYENPQKEFGKKFISPGHVHLLISSGIERRRGHTELSTSLMLMAGLVPSATIVEMLSEDGYSLSKEDARKFAEERKLTFLEGEEIVDAWLKWSE